MKSTILFTTALLSPCVTAFTATTSSSAVRPTMQPLHATMTADELSTISKSEQLKVLGVEEEKLALGIDADEVLEFIGTRDDLVAKFKVDIPKFSESEVQAEVDKLLMDGEMLDLWIKYQQRITEDPNWEPQYAPEATPFQKVVNFTSQYAIWIIGGILLKDIVSDYLPKNGGEGAGDAADVLVSSALEGLHQMTNMVV